VGLDNLSFGKNSFVDYFVHLYDYTIFLSVDCFVEFSEEFLRVFLLVILFQEALRFKY